MASTGSYIDQFIKFIQVNL